MHDQGRNVDPSAGTGGRTRTDNLLPEADFESAASTNSATPACSDARIGTKNAGPSSPDDG